jgi:hypothetical protein
MKTHSATVLALLLSPSALLMSGLSRVEAQYVQCAPGQFVVGTSCFDCQCGLFSVGGYSCSACASGYYSGTGSAFCSPSGFGYYTSDNCNDWPCDPGTYNDQQSASVCYDCPANTYASRPGASSCEACPPGQSSPPGSRFCTPDSSGAAGAPAGGTSAASASNVSSSGSDASLSVNRALAISGGVLGLVVVVGGVVAALCALRRHREEQDNAESPPLVDEGPKSGAAPARSAGHIYGAV